MEDIEDNSYQTSGLANLETYYWRVKAKNSEGETDWSRPWSFTTEAKVPTGPLVGYWNMDEGSGTTLSDGSEFSNNASFQEGPIWIAGVEGQALRFSNNQFASTADHNSLDLSTSLTIATWVKPERKQTQYLVKKAKQNTTDGYELALSNPGKFFFRFNQSAGTAYRIDSQTDYPYDGETWVHIAVSYDGQTMKLYVNGIEAVSYTHLTLPTKRIV